MTLYAIIGVLLILAIAAFSAIGTFRGRMYVEFDYDYDQGNEIADSGFEYFFASKIGDDKVELIERNCYIPSRTIFDDIVIKKVKNRGLSIVVCRLNEFKHLPVSIDNNPSFFY